MRKCPSSFSSRGGRASLFWIGLLLAGGLMLPPSRGQDVGAPVIDNTGSVANPKPTWETQKQARTFVLGIPAPRGQIVDRNGKPLAQTRLSYNLAINFPAPLNWTDAQILSFAHQQITLVDGLLGREIRVADSAILTHYKNRGVLPLDIATDLSPQELGIVQRGLTTSLILRQTYVRTYPEGSLAAHIIGYTHPEAPLSVRPIENNDLIFPESQGQEGIEQVFDDELRGQVGQLYITYDKNGNKTSERIARPPVPGYNIVTTLDIDLQRICEDVLAKNCKRGALVIIDPNSGEILAMASYPSFNPNEFVPTIPQAVVDRYNNDPSDPLVNRAYGSAYPPGSTFKTVVGLAGLQTGVIKPSTKFDCPSSFTVGDHTFLNWKKVGAGELNFVEALTQSCNTWFYQAGLKIGAPPIIDYAHKVGLGMRTGIPVTSENAGNIPTDDYMMRVQKRHFKPGDVANMAIGQGDILITPLQMAQAMGVLADAGQFHLTRLVMQVQSLDNKVVAAYPDRLRGEIPIDPKVEDQLKTAMQDVVYSDQGTAHHGQVKGVRVAGKTGTAQWGPTNKQKTAAWFAGFMPADNPQYAFAALYEGEAGDNTVHGGSSAAPMIGIAFKQIYDLKNGVKESDDKKGDSSNASDKDDSNKDESN